LHDSDLRLICVHLRQVLIFQFRRSLAIPAILAISRRPSPSPYVDPIRSKATQGDPRLRRSAEVHSSRMPRGAKIANLFG